MLGSGLLQGLAVTAKNLAGSFHDPARYVTTEYPEQRTKLPENYRNFPFLVHDDPSDPNGTMRCVACQICEKECPPQCIYIVMERDEKGKALKRPKVFDIDISVCMSCQICVEVCPFDAIKMDQEYEIATRDRFGGLLLHREDLSKSNAYYHQIHPTEAAGVDAGCLRRVDLVVVRVRLREVFPVQQQSAEAVPRRDLVLLVHLDRVERAHLDADLAAHADGDIDVEDLGPLERLSFLVPLHDDVDALRRTLLLANLAGHAAHGAIGVGWVVVDEEWEIAVVLRQLRALLGVLGRDVARRVVKAAREIFRGDREALEESGTEHGERVQRSTSPSTMSTLPRMMTASATVWPRHMSSSTVRLMNDGGRTR